MRAFKEHKFIVFVLDDESKVKYDLSTGKTYGKLGKEVKSLNSQLSGRNVYDVIDSFEDENYKAFLRFVLKYFINNSKQNKDHEVNKVRNVGTFLSRLNDYHRFEQYFAAGVHNIAPTISPEFNQLPKQLIKLCKEYNITLDDNIIANYLKDYGIDSNLLKGSDLFTNILTQECISFSIRERYEILKNLTRYPYRFISLVDEYNYNVISLVKYIDNLMTYEALTSYEIISELQDYCRMMITISTKFDKYPRNFLTTMKIATRNYNRLKQKFNEEEFAKKIDISLEWKYNDYSVIYPKTTQDIRDEAVQQNHCVASYIEEVIRGNCHIVFLRRTKNKEDSLITLEIKNNEVHQAKGRFNRDPTTNEFSIIEKYAKYLQTKQECAITC